jgi:hypothetical protein
VTAHNSRAIRAKWEYVRPENGQSERLIQRRSFPGKLPNNGAPT